MELPEQPICPRVRSIEKWTLHVGEQIHLLSGDGSDGVSASILRIRKDLIWLNRAEAPGMDGDSILIERRIENDAVYRAPGRIEILSSESWAVRKTGDWCRVQRRQDVRVATRGIHLELSSSPEDAVFLCSPMLDLSASGTALRSEAGAAADLAAGRMLHCRFTVPGVGTFDVGAQVIRVQSSGRTPGATRIALRFVDLEPDLEVEIRRWVLHVQARQAR